MALLKDIQTNFGVVASYWRIILIREDYENKVTKITFAGYLNKEARDNGALPIDEKIIVFENQTDFIRESAYNATKLNDTMVFFGAEDI